MDQGGTQRGGPRYNNSRVEQRLTDGKVLHTLFLSNFVACCFQLLILIHESPTAGTSKRKSTRDHDWFGVDIFRTGLIPQPKNPYFVTKRRQRAAELVRKYLKLHFLRHIDKTIYNMSYIFLLQR